MVYQTLHADLYLEGDIAESLKLISAAAKAAKIDSAAVNARRQRWTREHESYVKGLRAEREKAQNGSGIHPLALLGALGEVMPADTIYMDETITHSPLLRQHLPQTMPQSFFRGSGGLGQGIGTALGIKLAAPERPVPLQPHRPGARRLQAPRSAHHDHHPQQQEIRGDAQGPRPSLS